MKLLTRAVPLVALVGFLVLIGLGGCSATSEGLSDLDSVAADKDALDISYAGTDSVTSVTQALTLPTTGDNGTTITWVSSDTTVIANDGAVTRPDFIGADTSVTLTATITKNSASDTKTFTLTVIKKDQVDITNLDSAAFSLTVANTTVPALTGATHTAMVGGSLSLTAGTDYDLSITGTGVSSGAVSIANDGTITIADSIVVSDGGLYTVKATGKGNYNGEKTANFTLTVKKVVYNIGDTGPAGGKIFYENANYVTDGWRYLEAAPSDLSVTYKWGDTATSVTTGTAIGTGKSNTAAIVEALDGAGFTEDYAAKACADYSSGGKDDWFLPSKDELNELYKQKNTVGVASNVYWSSSEGSADDAWVQYFSSGGQDDDYKGNGRRVRAVRAF